MPERGDAQQSLMAVLVRLGVELPVAAEVSWPFFRDMKRGLASHVKCNIR
jgi:hypothetical protein